MKSAALLGAVGLGVVLTIQAPINAEVARRLGSPIVAAILSLSSSVLLLVVVALVSGIRVQASSFLTLPWWFFIAGACGAAWVAGSAMVVPIIGAAALLACVVFGQALGATVVDQFGLFRMPVKPIDVWRIVGLLVMFCGLYIFHRSGR